MGGNALKKYGIETERKSSEDFFKIASSIAIQLSYGLSVTSSTPIEFKYSESIQSQVVRCYRTKKDHGDLDVLIKVDDSNIINTDTLKKYINENFKPTVIHCNGGVLSFDYENFQIDFIPISEENWNVAQVYFSYDPLGNAMGKTFHKLNLSYGWDGLKYKYRNFNGRNSKNIIITKDPRKIFEFGGYDYDRYLKGFDTIEEIFDYIIDGKYFNAQTFYMENLNHIDRKRNNKRKSYHEFLKYVEDTKTGIYPKFYSFFADKSLYNQIIDQAFPEICFKEKLEELDTQNKINKQLQENLNGIKIMNWIPGLMGKELGDVYSGFKEYLGENYEHIVLETTENELSEQFISYYEKKYKKKYE